MGGAIFATVTIKRLNVSAQNRKWPFTSRPFSKLDSLTSFLVLLLQRSDLLRFVRLVLAVSAVALFRGAVKKAVYDGVWRGGNSSGTGGI